MSRTTYIFGLQDCQPKPAREDAGGWKSSSSSNGTTSASAVCYPPGGWRSLALLVLRRAYPSPTRVILFTVTGEKSSPATSLSGGSPPLRSSELSASRRWILASGEVIRAERVLHPLPPPVSVEYPLAIFWLSGRETHSAKGFASRAGNEMFQKSVTGSANSTPTCRLSWWLGPR